MFKSCVFLLFLTSSVLVAGNLPWIGVSLKCPDKTDPKHVALADGVGLKVGHVVNGGPLDKAGGKKGDLWWKFDDQILVSRGQLVVLLRSKKPGDTVSVEFFRGSKLQKISLGLSKWPESKTMLISTTEASSAPNVSSRKLESSKQTASLTVNDERLSLEKAQSGWRFKAERDDKVLFDRELTSSSVSSSLESRWLEPFMILQMTLVEKSSVKPESKKSRMRYILKGP